MTIDPNDPFTRELLRSLTATIRAQPDETEAEYAERFAAATRAFTAFQPRDPVEQMLVAEVLAAQFAGRDCLNRAAETEDEKLITTLHRSYATMNRAMDTAMRQLEKQKKRPDESLAPPPPAIEPIPPRRRATEQETTQTPMQREKPNPAPPRTDHAKMTDEELQAALAEVRALHAEALADPNHPLHEEAPSYERNPVPSRSTPVSNGA